MVVNKTSDVVIPGTEVDERVEKAVEGSVEIVPVSSVLVEVSASVEISEVKTVLAPVDVEDNICSLVECLLVCVVLGSCDGDVSVGTDGSFVDVSDIRVEAWSVTVEETFSVVGMVEAAELEECNDDVSEDTLVSSTEVALVERVENIEVLTLSEVGLVKVVEIVSGIGVDATVLFTSGESVDSDITVCITVVVGG